MKHGREISVSRNESHEAWPFLFPHGHSVTWEPDYLSPLSAISNAWKLRGEVISCQVYQPISTRALTSCANPPIFIPSKSSVRSSQEPHYGSRPKLRVHFDDCIELAFVGDEAWDLYTSTLAHEELQRWSDKPWTYTPSPPSREFSWRTLANLIYPFCDFARECLESESDPLQCQAIDITTSHRDSDISAYSSLPQWVLDLSDDFKICSTISQPTHRLPVLTWFVGTADFCRRTEAKRLFVDVDPREWKNSIWDAWQDVLAQNEELHYYALIPRNLRSTWHESEAEVLLLCTSSSTVVRVGLWFAETSTSENCENPAQFAVNSSSITSASEILHILSDNCAQWHATLCLINGVATFSDRFSVSNGDSIQIKVEKSNNVTNKPTHERILCDVTNLSQVKRCKFASSSHMAGAPLSSWAVLSSPSDKTVSMTKELDRSRAPYPKKSKMHEVPLREDVTSMVQLPSSIRIAFKNSPMDAQQENMMLSFHQGRADVHNQVDSPDGSGSIESRVVSPSVDSDGSDIRPPSSEEGRQEMLLFHLEDPPIRALVDWSSYEIMMSEIANHLAVRLEELVDVYEVAVTPPDLANEAAVTVVHVHDDIHPGSNQKLVLVDIQFHAHRSEAHYRSGPSIVRKVIPVPDAVSRDELLYKTNVDKYCRSQQGRCLVFVNTRRWPDYDLDRKRMAHGDYVRVAVPPSDRFSCPTEWIADMTQRGLSDQQIYDEIYNDDAVSGVSPSLLDEAEIRELAAEYEELDDVAMMMQQQPQCSMSGINEFISNHSSNTTDTSIPEDWYIDLQRLMQRHVAQSSNDPQADVIVPIYTWFVDHQAAPVCKDPKITYIGSDPSRWEQELTFPWEYRIVQGERVFLDLVSPPVPQAAVENHIAHVLITQRAVDLSTVLFSMEFADASEPSVYVRFALAVPKQCSIDHLVSAIPIFAAFSQNRFEWQHPSLGDSAQSFTTWSGLGMKVKIWSVADVDHESSDSSSVLQVTGHAHSSIPFCQKHTCRSSHCPDNEGLESADHAINKRFIHPFNSERNSTSPPARNLSLTDEFLRFVNAVSSAGEANNAEADEPNGLRDQPIWVQDLWEKWTETMSLTGASREDGLRLETWFTNPSRWSRCRSPRVVVLSPNFIAWERELLAAWPDRADIALPTNYAIVFPSPEDMDRTVQEQLIIEQQSEPFSRAIVATVYDTNRDRGRPYSHALTVGDVVDVRSITLLLGFSDHCPPEKEVNECLLWMGNIAIRRDQSLNIRLGNALRFLIRRGIKIGIPELLSMSDHNLRQELQAAITGAIFRRPNIVGFPADAFATSNPTIAIESDDRVSPDYPPEWLGSLLQQFERKATVERQEEGPVLYVLVWYVNGINFVHCATPKVVRIDSDNSWWRSEIIFPWRDSFSRGTAIDLHYVDPNPPKEAWLSHNAHIIVSQALGSEQVAVLITDRLLADHGTVFQHHAVIVNRFTNIDEVVAWSARPQQLRAGVEVCRGDMRFPNNRNVRVMSGDGITIQRVEERPGNVASGSAASSSHEHAASSSANVASRTNVQEESFDVEMADDSSFMQALQTSHMMAMQEESASTNENPACGLDIASSLPHESEGFQFNPTAEEFRPGAVPLPAWAMTIEEIYHDWDLNAFAWQGESRATHFMTWYVAPGIDRLRCLHGRKVALFADFWNWRDQIRQQWIGEIDQNAEYDLIYVSPPPSQLEAGITGHIILIQHSSPEWSAVLVSIFDQAINHGYSFKTAVCVSQNAHFHDISMRIGYDAECSHHAQCDFWLRNFRFRPNDQYRSSDGDAVDLRVRRQALPPNWQPPIIPHSPGAEGLSLLQVRAEISKPMHDADSSQTASSSAARVVSIAKATEATDHDIKDVPFTLAKLLEVVPNSEMPVFCVWEIHGGATDFTMSIRAEFSKEKMKTHFCQKHGLLKECSELFPVRFRRDSWKFAPDAWFVGSYIQPAPCSAVVVGVEYRKEGAIARSVTLHRSYRTDLLRSTLGIQFGTLIRLNGEIVLDRIHFQHGDVLEYHAVESSKSICFDRFSSKTQICLEAAIDNSISCFDPEDDAFEILQDADLSDALRNEDRWRFECIPEGTNLHKSTYEALHVQHEVIQGNAQTLELYIDGATCGDVSAWAVVAVKVAESGRSFHGCCAGLTEINAQSNQWIGAVRHSNIEAELSAMVVSTAFSIFASEDLPVVIRPDLSLSRRFLSAECASRHESAVAKLVYVLGQLLPPNVQVHEIRAHCGDPWNELADSVAKLVAKTRLPVGRVPWELINKAVTSPSTLKWEWLRSATSSYAKVMPALHGHAVWQPVPSAKRVDVSVASTDVPRHDVKIHIKVATYNSLALNDEEQPETTSCSRTARLDQQFHQEKIAIIGVQEARTMAGRRVSDHYCIFSSGFQQCGRSRHFGCELWVHKTMPLCVLPDGNKVCLADCKLTVTVSDARTLIARIEGVISFQVVVAHAPCVSAEHPVDLVQQWWGSLSDHIQRGQSAHTIVLIDANAPLADIDCKFFGTHQAEPMNVQGHAFQEFLITNLLYVPATFATHSGTAGTWKHPRGGFLRRDYVAMSEMFFSMSVGSKVQTDFDGGFGHMDHCPAVCEIAGFWSVQESKRKFAWDYAKLQDPKTQNRFAEALATLPMPAWSTSVDDHSTILETNILQIARQFFSKKTHEKSRPMLSETTLTGIQLKRQALDMARSQQFPDPVLVDEIKALEKILRPMVQRDQKEWYAAWLDGINVAGSNHDTAQIYRKLQRLGRRKKDLEKGPKPLPRLQLGEGHFAQSFEECQRTWMKQFAEVEAGIEVSDIQLHQLHCSVHEVTERNLSHCADPYEVLSIIRGFKNRKVPGPGQLPVDIIKSGGIHVAKLLTPLLVKASWHVREPLSWKGGLLVPLFKGKGSPSEPGAYRSIFLSDICAKIHHAKIRSQLAEVWNKDDSLIQMGGRKGCSTDVAHHFLHAHMSWARHSNSSCAVLFVDLQSAFYSVIRSSLFDQEIHDDIVCFAMKALGILPEEWHEIRICVESDYATKGVDTHCEGILRDMFSGTHFSMHGINENIATQRGTRPGDPVADILFNMAFKLVLLDARTRIQDSTDIVWFGSPLAAKDLTHLKDVAPRGFAEITFVDDVAYAVHSKSAVDVISSLQIVSSCLHDAAAARGLTINYNAGKTEAIVRLAGHGSKAAKHRLWHECGGHLPIVTEHGSQSLKVVHAYKHLGSFVQEHAIVQKDMRFRIAQARKAFGQLSRQFYCKKNVHLSTKSSVFAALVLSRHSYNVHTWAWVTDREIDTWANGIKQQIASLASCKIKPIPAFQFSTTELCALCGINSPWDSLHAQRLRYVSRAISMAPDMLWSFLHANTNECSWGARVIESARWLARNLPSSTIPDFVSLQDVLSFVAIDQKWNGKIKAALRSCLNFHSAAAEGKLWTLRMQWQVSKFADVSLPLSRVKNCKWKCSLCGDGFASKKALAVHSRHVHQYRTILKYFVLGEDCLACGKMFFSRARLLAHVGAAAKCKASYLACFVPATEDEVDRIESSEKEQNQALRAQGWLPSKAFLPAIQGFGPFLPECGTEGAAAMQDKWKHRIPEAGRAFEGLDGFCEQEDEAQQADEVILPFLMQTNGGKIQGEAGVFQSFGLAAEAARLHIRGFLFVHFFSGFRRAGDLQHCIEDHSIVGTDHIFCISVDLCLAKKHSDLTDTCTKNFWISKMRDGQVLGIGGGPSCETWSAARHAPGGPKPLRAYGCPWGLEGLNKRQWDQVNTGTKLIQFLVELLIVAAQLGMCGFLEHPQFPVWLVKEKPASIWSLQIMRVLARLECFQICSFDQCVYELAATKPTTLLLLRLNTFKDITMTKGNRGRCSHRAKHQPLQGIQNDGSFATARAKIYPVALNKAIAVAVSRFLTERHLQSSWCELPHDLQELRCTEVVDESVVQPDFHR